MARKTYQIVMEVAGNTAKWKRPDCGDSPCSYSAPKLFAVLCAVTFILTAMALKKFRRDIAFDLSSGRTRQ